MSIKVNPFQNISSPNQLDTKIDQKAESANKNITVSDEVSSTSSFHTHAGQMRKLQLLR